MSTATLPPPTRPARPARPVTVAPAPLDPTDLDLLRHRITPEEYGAIGDLGLLSGKRTELVDGHILVMPPQGPPHASGLSAANDEMRRIFDAKSHWIRGQLPLIVGPEWVDPDCAVVVGSRQSWDGKPHPATALIVVEVSDSTLRYDRRTKAGMYASAGVPDYWILNLIDRVLEVHRDPVADAAWPFGHRYADVRVLDAAAGVSPLAMPGATVKVADLLP